jgi:hypothetical protein
LGAVVIGSPAVAIGLTTVDVGLPAVAIGLAAVDVGLAAGACVSLAFQAFYAKPAFGRDKMPVSGLKTTPAMQVA